MSRASVARCVYVVCTFCGVNGCIVGSRKRTTYLRPINVVVVATHVVICILVYVKDVISLPQIYIYPQYYRTELDHAAKTFCVCNCNCAVVKAQKYLRDGH